MIKLDLGTLLLQKIYGEVLEICYCQLQRSCLMMTALVESQYEANRPNSIYFLSLIQEGSFTLKCWKVHCFLTLDTRPW